MDTIAVLEPCGTDAVHHSVCDPMAGTVPSGRTVDLDTGGRCPQEHPFRILLLELTTTCFNPKNLETL